MYTYTKLYQQNAVNFTQHTAKYHQGMNYKHKVYYMTYPDLTKNSLVLLDSTVFRKSKSLMIRSFFFQHLAPSVLMGHDSSIATVTNLFPTLVHDIVQSVKKNDVVKARKLQEKLNNLVDAITCNGIILFYLLIILSLTL